MLLLLYWSSWYSSIRARPAEGPWIWRDQIFSKRIKCSWLKGKYPEQACVYIADNSRNTENWCCVLDASVESMLSKRMSASPLAQAHRILSRTRNKITWLSLLLVLSHISYQSAWCNNIPIIASIAQIGAFIFSTVKIIYATWFWTKSDFDRHCSTPSTNHNDHPRFTNHTVPSLHHPHPSSVPCDQVWTL